MLSHACGNVGMPVEPKGRRVWRVEVPSGATIRMGPFEERLYPLWCEPAAPLL
jgi:hypothetical protein